MEIDLVKEKKLLEANISELELRMAPIQQELKERRERLFHVKALLPKEQIKPFSSPGNKLPYGFWANKARELGLDIGGDSAHRVVMREVPEVHKSIPHQCELDNRIYP